MKLDRPATWALWGTLLFIFGTGCGTPQPIKVEGLVTLDGNPVEDATVTFVPKGTVGRVAMCKTDADGFFQLTTFAAADGALPGDYKVTVSKIEASRLKHDPKDPEALKEYDHVMSGKERPMPGGYLLPPIYADPVQTPFEFQVPPTGKITLACVSNPHP